MSLTGGALSNPSKLKGKKIMPKEDVLSNHYQGVGNRYNRLYQKLFGNQREKIVQYLIDHFIGSQSKRKMIADVGGGTGQTIELLKERTDSTNHYILVDPYQSMLDQALLRKGKPDGMIRETAEDFVANPQYESQFDVLICQEMIHHVHNHRLFFEGTLKLLREGGMLIVITRPLVVEFPFGKHGKKIWKDSYAIDPAKMGELLKTIGLKVHEETYSYPIRIDKSSWMEIIGREPLFSDISKLTPWQIEEDLREIEKMPDELLFNDNQLFIVAEKR